MQYPGFEESCEAWNTLYITVEKRDEILLSDVAVRR